MFAKKRSTEGVRLCKGIQLCTHSLIEGEDFNADNASCVVDSKISGKCPLGCSSMCWLSWFSGPGFCSCPCFHLGLGASDCSPGLAVCFTGPWTLLGSAARSSPTTRTKTGRTAHVFTGQGGHTPEIGCTPRGSYSPKRRVSAFYMGSQQPLLRTPSKKPCQNPPSL